MKTHNAISTPAAPSCQPDGVRVPLFRVVRWAGWARTNGEARRVVRGGSIRVDLEQELDENRLVGVGQHVSTRRRNHDGITEYLITMDAEAIQQVFSGEIGEGWPSHE